MWIRVAFVALGLSFVGCGDDDRASSGDMGVADAGADMEVGCQPASPHEELLMAPTTADVLHKPPTHPPVGDGGLP